MWTKTIIYWNDAHLRGTLFQQIVKSFVLSKPRPQTGLKNSVPRGEEDEYEAVAEGPRYQPRLHAHEESHEEGQQAGQQVRSCTTQRLKGQPSAIAWKMLFWALNRQSLVAISGPKKVSIFKVHPFQWPSSWIFPISKSFFTSPRHLTNRYINRYKMPDTQPWVTGIADRWKTYRN
jgi:hypothetical protein